METLYIIIIIILLVTMILLILNNNRDVNNYIDYTKELFDTVPTNSKNIVTQTTTSTMPLTPPINSSSLSLSSSDKKVKGLEDSQMG